jgi:hypothetical protein
LAQVKIYHWDKEIRELASAALAKLATRNPKYIEEKVLPVLVHILVKLPLML